MSESLDGDFPGKVLVVTLEAGPEPGPRGVALKDARLVELGGRTFLQGERAMAGAMGLPQAKIMVAWDKVLKVLLFDSMEQFMAQQAMNKTMARPFPGMF